jgi:hypothetical protein
VSYFGKPRPESRRTSITSFTVSPDSQHVIMLTQDGKIVFQSIHSESDITTRKTFDLPWFDEHGPRDIWGDKHSAALGEKTGSLYLFSEGTGLIRYSVSEESGLGDMRSYPIRWDDGAPIESSKIPVQPSRNEATIVARLHQPEISELGISKRDGFVVLDLNSGEILLRREYKNDDAKDLEYSLSADGYTLVLFEPKGPARNLEGIIVNLRTGTEMPVAQPYQLNLMIGFPKYFEVSPDGKLMAASVSETEGAIWDPRNGNVIKKYRQNSHLFFNRWGATSNTIVYTHEPEEVGSSYHFAVKQFQDGKPVDLYRIGPISSEMPLRPVFSPDGKYFIYRESDDPMSENQYDLHIVPIKP